MGTIIDKFSFKTVGSVSLRITLSEESSYSWQAPPEMVNSVPRMKVDLSESRKAT